MNSDPLIEEVPAREVFEGPENLGASLHLESELSANSSKQFTPQPHEIAFEGLLHVNGYLAGVVRSTDGHLTVEAGGTVDADVFVSILTVHGCVRGDIFASQRVELSGSAKVIGDIETVLLSIEPGAVFEGRCLFRQPAPAPDSAEARDNDQALAVSG